MNTAKKFYHDASRIAFDEAHRKKIDFNMSRYDLAVEKGMKRYRDVEAAKNQAAAIKREVLNHLDEYLLQFEKNITSHGVEVFWARNSEEAIAYVEKILVENEARLLVKSKSMTTEEIELNAAVAKLDCESVETDLGEFIVQTAGEKPYHIVTPAMHKSKSEIANLFHDKFGTPPESTPEELSDFVRCLLRKKFTQAQIGVTGANFLIADIGGISVTENEGNALMSTSFPKIHLVFAGIEKIIPKMEQLGLFYPLLAVHGTGQQVTAYNTIFTGPRQTREIDGPEKMYVILLDNGRIGIFADDEAYESLACIRCGACLNGCPVYRTIGGYTYNATYSGPIGSAITPFLKGFRDFYHLSYASTLCGKCAEVCPVKIPLPDIFLANRRKAVEQQLSPAAEKAAMKGFRLIASKRKGFDFFPAVMKNSAFYPLNYWGWGPKRAVPKFAKKSFSQLYRKQNKQNIN